MAKSTIKNTAKVADTVRPTVAGAKERPVWHALRTIAGRITTPLLPDDYLQLANPLWSARELRGRVVEVRREPLGVADQRRGCLRRQRQQQRPLQRRGR